MSIRPGDFMIQPAQRTSIHCLNHNQILRFSTMLIFIVYGLATSVAHAGETRVFSLEEVVGNAAWATSNLDITIDVTDTTPRYCGEIQLELTGRESFGPMLLLNNREVSMHNLKLEVLNAAELPAYRVVTAEKNPADRPSTITYIEFEESLQEGAVVNLAFTYEFFEEQGQLFSRPSKEREDWVKLHYASWVTGWYPYLVSDDSTLVTIRNLSSPGTTRFVMPADMRAISNGILVSDNVSGATREQLWKVTNRLARSYTVAPFTVSTSRVGDVDVGMYVLADNEEIVETQSAQLIEIFRTLENSFGDYPFDSFAIAEIPDESSDYFAASSEQGFIVAGSSYFENDYGLALFAHEAGHAWWGNKFACTEPSGALCSEGFANYGAALMYENLFGEDAMRDFMEVSAPDYWPAGSVRGYFAMLRQGDEVPVSQASGWQVHRVSLPKGTYFLQMLREKIGDEKFFAILRSLPTLGRNLSLDELEKYFSDRSGINLKVFFDQWLHRSGVPHIEMNWSVHNAQIDLAQTDRQRESVVAQWTESPKTVVVELIQKQEELYDLDIEVEIQNYYSPPVVKKIRFDERILRFEVKTEGRVKDVKLDPNRRILMWRPAYGPMPEKPLPGSDSPKT